MRLPKATMGAVQSKPMMTDQNPVASAKPACGVGSTRSAVPVGGRARRVAERTSPASIRRWRGKDLGARTVPRFLRLLLLGNGEGLLVVMVVMVVMLRMSLSGSMDMTIQTD
jgi:hypothetical protein